MCSMPWPRPRRAARSARTARGSPRSASSCTRPISRARGSRGQCEGGVILEVENVELYYGDAQALDGISLGAEEGELVAIVGANGAGKSSLIRTIAGIETPRGGR